MRRYLGVRMWSMLSLALTRARSSPSPTRRSINQRRSARRKALLSADCKTSCSRPPTGKSGSKPPIQFYASLLSSALAAFRSAVSKPSVNQS